MLLNTFNKKFAKRQVFSSLKKTKSQISREAQSLRGLNYTLEKNRQFHRFLIFL